MESKPNSPNVCYINFNGDTIVDNSRLGWVSYANGWDLNGSRITSSNRSYSLKVPSATLGNPNINTSKILQIVSKKFEPFDINVTDSSNIYNSANGFKCKVLVTSRPTLSTYNSLILNKDESNTWPYSYRKMLRYRFASGRPDLAKYDYKFWTAQGLSAPDVSIPIINYNLSTEFASLMGNKIIMVWVNNQDYTPIENIDGQFSSPAGVETKFTDIVIAGLIAHEFSHRFPLQHDTIGNDKWSYYPGHNDWAPIMGGDPPYGNTKAKLFQWSKGEYGGANIEDDIDIISKKIGLIKKPTASSNSSISAKHQNFSDSNCWNDSYNARIITSSDVITSPDSKKVIEGMIGFPGDFDVIKMLLPYGSYDFIIDARRDKNQGSMFDPEIWMLNCNCHTSKGNNSSLPTFYPEDLSANKMQCINFNSCLGGGYTSSKKRGDNDNFSATTLPVTLTNTSIVYLLIKGGKFNTPSVGWSNYSSIGKYYLQINRNGSNNPETFLPTDILPACRCSEYNYCKKGVDGKALLYVQDDNDSGGTNSSTKAHIKELDVLIDGETKKKKFLVYGEPIGVNADEGEGKFYLSVVIDGKAKKQEFVVGESWEKKST